MNCFDCLETIKKLQRKSDIHLKIGIRHLVAWQRLQEINRTVAYYLFVNFSRNSSVSVQVDHRLLPVSPIHELEVAKGVKTWMEEIWRVFSFVIKQSRWNWDSYSFRQKDERMDYSECCKSDLFHDDGDEVCCTSLRLIKATVNVSQFTKALLDIRFHQHHARCRWWAIFVTDTQIESVAIYVW